MNWAPVRTTWPVGVGAFQGPAAPDTTTTTYSSNIALVPSDRLFAQVDVDLLSLEKLLRPVQP